jgi:hypothetical protein
MDRITHQPPRQQGYGSTSSLRNDSLKHTRKHERRRRESKQGTKLSASGGLSGQAGRTVHKGHADSPARCRGQSARDTRTVRPGATDRPRRPGGLSARATDHPLLKLGPSANRLQRKPKPKPDQNETKQEHKERPMNWLLADCPPAPRGPSAPHGQN